MLVYILKMTNKLTITPSICVLKIKFKYRHPSLPWSCEFVLCLVSSRSLTAASYSFTKLEFKVVIPPCQWKKKLIVFHHRNKLRLFFICMAWEMHILNDTSILILPCISHIFLAILWQHSMSHIHHFQYFLLASYFVPSCNAGQEIYVFSLLSIFQFQY